MGRPCVSGVLGDSYASFGFDQRQALLGTSGSDRHRLDTTLYRNAADQLKTDDKFLATAGIGVGNSAAATTLGSVTEEDRGLRRLRHQPRLRPDLRLDHVTEFKEKLRSLSFPTEVRPDRTPPGDQRERRYRSAVTTRSAGTVPRTPTSSSRPLKYKVKED